MSWIDDFGTFSTITWTTNNKVTIETMCGVHVFVSLVCMGACVVTYTTFTKSGIYLCDEHCRTYWNSVLVLRSYFGCFSTSDLWEERNKMTNCLRTCIWCYLCQYTRFYLWLISLCLYNLNHSLECKRRPGNWTGHIGQVSWISRLSFGTRLIHETNNRSRIIVSQL